jgi:hypothetical protein
VEVEALLVVAGGDELAEEVAERQRVSAENRGIYNRTRCRFVV